MAPGFSPNPARLQPLGSLHRPSLPVLKEHSFLATRQGSRLAAHRPNLVPRWVLFDLPRAWKKNKTKQKNFFWISFQHLKTKKFHIKIQIFCFFRRNNKRIWQSGGPHSHVKGIGRCWAGAAPFRRGKCPSFHSHPHPACSAHFLSQHYPLGVWIGDPRCGNLFKESIITFPITKCWEKWKDFPDGELLGQWL